MTALLTADVRVPATQRAGLLRHAGFLTVRSTKALWRQPAFAAATLIQPIIWLLLFGELFRPVVEIPGFEAAHGSYLEFITPGVVVMTALFSSGWAGTVYIEDMNRGVMDRLLASPVRRGAMMIGTLAYQGLTTVLQTLVIVGIALVAGAGFTGGVAGVAVTVLAAVLISVIVASMSNALALLLRQQEALIGISQFVVLPLQFLSSAVMDTELSPDWVQSVAGDSASRAATTAQSTGL
jgi:ABC-2 type transport system permease protein